MYNSLNTYSYILVYDQLRLDGSILLGVHLGLVLKADIGRHCPQARLVLRVLCAELVRVQYTEALDRPCVYSKPWPKLDMHRHP